MSVVNPIMHMRTLTLTKDGHIFVFRYASGYEDEVINEIMQLAEDEECTLDWLDAATLSFQIARYAADAHNTVAAAPEDYA